MSKPKFKLHTESIGDNLHGASTWINKMGWADYVLVMQSHGFNTQIVFRMPAAMVYKIREESKSYVADPHHDDPK